MSINSKSSGLSSSSASVATSVISFEPPSKTVSIDTVVVRGASFTAAIVIVAVATFESALPSLALYVKLSLVVSLPSWV